MQMADGEGNPLNARGGIGDHITGLAALAGILAAVLEQRQTGVGRVVEVSLLRTGAYVLGWDLGLQMALGKVSAAEPRDRNQSPLMNPYRAADGRWFFFTGLEADRHIGPVVRALGPARAARRPAVRRRPAIRRNRGRGHRPPRRDHRRSAPRPSGPSASTARASGGRWPRPRPRWSADPQLLANDGFVEVEGGALRSVNGPVSFSDVVHDPTVGVPLLGEHTAEVVRSWPSGTTPRGARPPAAAQVVAARARASRPRAMTRRWISLVPSPMTISGASR